MNDIRKMLLALFLAAFAHGASGYSYLRCSSGLNLDFGGGHMTFNFADNLSTAEKTSIRTAFNRLTASSDTSITTIDNADSSYGRGNGENEIWRDATGTSCSYRIFDVWPLCFVTEADIRFGTGPWVTGDNSDHLPFDSAAGQPISAAAIHEGGHCLGMDHVNDRYNMMGQDYTHVTRNEFAAYYGPGEDLSDGLIDLHGKRSSSNIYRDVGATVFRYDYADGEYSVHKWGVLRDTGGARLPISGSFSGQAIFDVKPGQAVDMELTFENNGEQDVETPQFAYYLSDNSLISEQDRLLATGSFNLWRDRPYEFARRLTVPSDVGPGYYFLGVYVDYNKLIGETTGLNNIAYYPIRVVAPDLVADSPLVSDSTLVWDQSFLVYASVRNQGNLSSAGSTLRYYLSDDTSITTGDTQMGTDAVGTLGPGGSLSYSEAVHAPTVSGTYWVGACVDSVAGESIIDNQCTNGVQVTIGPPPPTVYTKGVTVTGPFAADLEAAVNPNGTETVVYFNYWRKDGEVETVTYGKIGSGNSDIIVTQATGFIGCSTEFYFQPYAKNNGGVTYGTVMTFTTAKCPPGCE